MNNIYRTLVFAVACAVMLSCGGKKTVKIDLLKIVILRDDTAYESYELL